jgi:hypothetical protein
MAINAYGVSRVQEKTGRIQSAGGSIWRVSLVPDPGVFSANQPVNLTTAYVYRLCLEYARLAADDRGAMDFEL